VTVSQRLGFTDLHAQVIAPQTCTGCGACVTVCPFDGVLGYEELTPQLVGECRNCGICLRVCPRYDLQVEELETASFGRTRRADEPFGVVETLQVAQTRDEAVREKGQDGGIATTLLTTALSTGMIDGAVVSGVDPATPWLPTPVAATTHGELLACAGTRYTYSPGLLAFKKALGKGLKRIAFVGTPCQIQALRQMEKSNLRKYTDPIAFTVGLFCSESFTYGGLMERKIQRELGIDLHQIVEMNIKGKMRVTGRDGEVYELPLKELSEYVESKCGYCTDFSAELADIALGGVGLDGWTFVVVRTAKGAEVVRQAIEAEAVDVQPATAFPRAGKLLRRLSKIKRNKAKALP
jgi:coenzyme F420 hydrogenase subunit beta